MTRGQAGYRAKQALGQHFLRDGALLDELVALAGVRKEDSVFEIGPGMGDLTLALAKKAGKVLALEIDPDLMPILRVVLSGQSNVSLAQGDVLKADLPQLLRPLGPFSVVANLPYYVTTPIMKLLLNLPLPVKSIHVMLQWEAAQRVIARPSTADYGPLSLLARYRAEAEILKRIPAGAFSPPPKTDSAFIALLMRDEPAVRVRDPALLFRLVDAAFAMRRKTLVNNLMPAFGLGREEALALLERLRLSATVRGEALSLQDFAALADVVAAAKNLSSVDRQDSLG